MRLRYLAVCASLAALAACDGAQTNPILPDAGPSLANGFPERSLYSTQVPTEFLDATGGWEVGTRFVSTNPGRIIGFRFYRAPGETGFNYGKLWSPSGEQLKKSAAFPQTSGWVTVMLGNSVDIQPGVEYRVSVNTNSKQAKTPGGYVHQGPLSSGALSSDGGWYGQPTGARPTNGSASYYFVDVIFEEWPLPPPMPDLYVLRVWPLTASTVGVTICNGGNAVAPAFNARFWHWVAPLPTGSGWWKTQTDALAFPSLAANGGCDTKTVASSIMYGYRNEFHARADIGGVVAESNENNNQRIETANF